MINLMYPRPLTPPKKRRRKAKFFIVSLLMVVIAGTYTVITITRPFAELSASVPKTELAITTQASTLPWPTYGQGAFGLNGKVIARHGKQEQVAIASVTKVITALVILERHPMAVNEDGESFTMDADDVALYNRYVSINGSVTPVSVGQKLTQRDMIEAIMLPSANNIADELAIWSFGSIAGYVDYANKYLAKNGLNDTVVGGDASGYLPDSRSTMSDLVKLGALAMQNKTLAAIVEQKTAVIPGVGTVKNYNNLLGTNGIVGVKTGNNDENGGVFLGATTAQVNGKTVTLITALGGAPNLGTVLRDSGTLLAAVRTTFADTTIVQKDAVLATYTQPTGRALQAVAARDLSITALRGDSVKATVKIDSIGYNATVGQTVGSVTIPATDYSPETSVPIVLKHAPTKPDIWYRLLHP
jgi:serine-type D-Ala-D-Ala carboxypeptidase (penicillin-binding protein 5/6)